MSKPVKISLLSGILHFFYRASNGHAMVFINTSLAISASAEDVASDEARNLTNFAFQEFAVAQSRDIDGINSKRFYPRQLNKKI